MTLVARLLTFLALLAGSSFAHGQEYPLRSAANTDVIYLQNSKVDFSLRAHYISHAKKSVQMINFLHGADPVGYKIAQALRHAAMNGVRVQYAYEGSISRTLGGDLLGKIRQLLTDSSLTRLPEVITARASEKHAANLAINDYFHEKLIIIDGGTPDEKIFIGGRGATANDNILLDAAYLLRPVDPSKPYIGTDLVTFFNEFWSDMTSIYSLEKPQNLSRALAREAEAAESVTTNSSNDTQTLHELISLIDKPAAEETDLAPFQFRPQGIQLVGNHFLHTMLNVPIRKTLYARPELYKNPFTQKMSDLIRKGFNVELTSYSTVFPDIVEDALVELTQRGGTVELFTNGRAAHAIFSPKGIPADYTLAAFLELMQRAPLDNIKLNFLSPQASSRAGGSPQKPMYVHRKLGIIDNMVITGSDNFTPSSASKNDEFMIFMDDPRMAQALREQTAREKALYYQTVTVDDVRSDYKKTKWISKYCMRLIGAMY